MPLFASVNGKLTIPLEPHPEDSQYESVGIGKPLCVEILHWAFGDVEDWWGKSEILSASWSKLGRSSKPGPRLVHFVRKGISKFEHIDQLGADQYGHRLVFYTPAYDGRELRITLQYVELDKATKGKIDAISKTLRSLGSLPVFAAQLPFVLGLPNALELGRKIYNLFNRNDKILEQRLDLRLDDPDFNRLTSGRYVVIEGGGSHLIDKFTRKYKLGNTGSLRNTLITTEDNDPAELSGMLSPYIVLRVNAKEVPGYEGFEIESAAQEMIEAVLNGDFTDDVADLISDVAKAAKEYGTVKEIMARKREMETLETDEEKTKKREEIQNLLKLIGDKDQVSLLTSAFDLKIIGSS